MQKPPAKGYLDLQVMFCLFLFFHPLKRGDLDIIKRRIPKRKALGFEAFQMFCCEMQDAGTAYLHSEHP